MPPIGKWALLLGIFLLQGPIPVALAKNENYQMNDVCKNHFLRDLYRKIDGAVLTSQNERNLDCAITFQTHSILQRFMLRFDRLQLDCNDHLYIYDGAHAVGNFKVDLSCRSTESSVSALYTRTNFVTLKYVTDAWGTDTNGFRLVISAIKDPKHACKDFRCTTKEFCIDTDLVCDGIRHCEDGSDETASTLCANPEASTILGMETTLFAVAMVFVVLSIVGIVAAGVLCFYRQRVATPRHLHNAHNTQTHPPVIFPYEEEEEGEAEEGEEGEEGEEEGEKGEEKKGIGKKKHQQKYRGAKEQRQKYQYEYQQTEKHQHNRQARVEQYQNHQGTEVQQQKRQITEGQCQEQQHEYQQTEKYQHNHQVTVEHQNHQGTEVQQQKHQITEGQCQVQQHQYKQTEKYQHKHQVTVEQHQNHQGTEVQQQKRQITEGQCQEQQQEHQRTEGHCQEYQRKHQRTKEQQQEHQQKYQQTEKPLQYQPTEKHYQTHQKTERHQCQEYQQNHQRIKKQQEHQQEYQQTEEPPQYQPTEKHHQTHQRTGRPQQKDEITEAPNQEQHKITEGQCQELQQGYQRTEEQCQEQEQNHQRTKEQCQEYHQRTEEQCQEYQQTEEPPQYQPTHQRTDKQHQEHQITKERNQEYQRTEKQCQEHRQNHQRPKEQSQEYQQEHQQNEEPPQYQPTHQRTEDQHQEHQTTKERNQEHQRTEERCPEYEQNHQRIEEQCQEYQQEHQQTEEPPQYQPNHQRTEDPHQEHQTTKERNQEHQGTEEQCQEHRQNHQRTEEQCQEHQKNLQRTEQQCPEYQQNHQRTEEQCQGHQTNLQRTEEQCQEYQPNLQRTKEQQRPQSTEKNHQKTEREQQEDEITEAPYQEHHQTAENQAPSDQSDKKPTRRKNYKKRKKKPRTPKSSLFLKQTKMSWLEYPSSQKLIMITLSLFLITTTFLHDVLCQNPDLENLIEKRNKSSRDFLIGPCLVKTNNTCPDPEVQFFLYTKLNPETAQQVFVNDSESNLSGTNFESANPTKIIVHGYNSDMQLDSLVDIRNEYLKKDLGYNLIAVDWHRLANGPCYPVAVHNVPHVGSCLAQLINRLRETGAGDIHVIGFSLGAHVPAFAANNLRPYKLSRITGLDPAMPLFVTVSDDEKLDKGDAEFVDIFHTNAFIQGKVEATGHIDFYMNGGINQPGCWQKRNPFGCNHHRAAMYFAESVNSEVGFWGWPCPGFLAYLLGLCPPKFPAVLAGDRVNRNYRGFHLVKTKADSPFAEGIFNLSVRDKRMVKRKVTFSL